MTGYDKVRKGYKWEVLALLWVATIAVAVYLIPALT